MKVLGYIGIFGLLISIIIPFLFDHYQVSTSPTNKMIWFGGIILFGVMMTVGITSPKFKSSRIGY